MPVSTSHHELHLLPREIARPDRVATSRCRSTPEPAAAARSLRLVRQPCDPPRDPRARTRDLTVTSDVERRASRAPPPPDDGGPWESARDWVRAGADPEARAAFEMALPSPHVELSAGGARVRRAVVPARPPARRGGGGSDAPHPRRVHLRPERDRRRRRSVDEVLRGRRGVCQDFAHLQIACLRALRPRRPLRQRLPGHHARRRASRAWSAPTPRTPGCRSALPGVRLARPRSRPTTSSPTDRHIIVAYGRDFGDVTPMRGVIARRRAPRAASSASTCRRSAVSQKTDREP